MLLPTSDKVIETELLKIFQQNQEAINNRSKLIASISSLTGLPISVETGFQKPLLSINAGSELNRPELGLYGLQKEEIQHSKKTLSG